MATIDNVIPFRERLEKNIDKRIYGINIEKLGPAKSRFLNSFKVETDGVFDIRKTLLKFLDNYSTMEYVGKITYLALIEQM